MSTPRRSAEILNHYFRQLFEAQGLTWSRENQQDIIDLVRGLAAPQARPSVPPAPPAAPAAPRPAPRSYDTVNIQREPSQVSSRATWLEDE